MIDRVRITIGGEAGFGIMAAGTMLTKALSRKGYHILATNEYPSLIRGGHNVVSVEISKEKFFAPKKDIDILVALNRGTIDLHKDKLRAGSIIVCDPKDIKTAALKLSDKTAVMLPMEDIVEKLHGDSVMRNTVALGAVLALLGAHVSYLSDVISDQFQKKGKEIIDENIAVVKRGYDYVKKTYPKLTDLALSAPNEVKDQLVLNGSEIVGLGALYGGMKFAAIYPMTPISALIPLFSDNAKELGIVYKQPEDEIAGINMAIGASLAGVRSMVATSGGGFCLMTEGLSLAGVMEVPLVIDLGMRPGPATGMPTWTGQGELLFAVHAGHGEFGRIVLSPGDAEECFACMQHAFSLAEKYQTIVIVLTDKYLNENQWCVSKDIFSHVKNVTDLSCVVKDDFKTDGLYKRYDLNTKDGVSKRSFLGMEYGVTITNSYEHDEKGFTTEESTMRIQMSNKRKEKFETMRSVAPPPTIFGDTTSDITLVSFGSTKGPILEAMNILQNQGKKAKLIHFSWVYPMSVEKVKEILSQEKNLFTVEGNGTGQLRSLIREETGIDIPKALLKDDGRQWEAQEIADAIS